MSQTLRIVLLGVFYVAATWVSFIVELTLVGFDGPILTYPLFLIAGVSVVVQRIKFRDRPLDWRYFLYNAAVMSLAGLAVGAFGAAPLRGAAIGLGLGLLTAGAVFILRLPTRTLRRPRALYGLVRRWLHKPHVFLCYRRDDTRYLADRLRKKLAGRFGKRRVYMDVHSGELGADYREEITEVIRRCDVMLVVIGDRWLSIMGDDGQRRLDAPSDAVRTEIETALAVGVRVIPLFAGAATLTSAALPASIQALSYRQGLHLRPDPDFDFDVKRLIAKVRSVEDQRQESPEEALSIPGRIVLSLLAIVMLLPIISAMIGYITAVASLEAAALSPDRRRIAAVYRDDADRRTLRLWAADTGRSIGEAPLTTGVDEIDWTPDGKRLALRGRQSALSLWNVDTLTLSVTFEPDRSDAVAISADGRWLASAKGGLGGSEIRLWDLSRPDPVDKGRLLFRTDSIDAFAIAPDSKHLAVTGYKMFGGRVLELVRLADGEIVRRLDSPHESIGSVLVWSHDGSRLASGGSSPPYVALRDVDRHGPSSADWQVLTYEPLRAEQGPSSSSTYSEVLLLSFSPDDRLLAAVSRDDTLRVWETDSRASRFVRELEDPRLDPGLVWSPDGRYLAVSDSHGVHVWQAERGELEAELIDRPNAGLAFRDPGWATVLGWSPDGNSIVSWSHWTDALCIWDVPTKELRLRITVPG